MKNNLSKPVLSLQSKTFVVAVLIWFLLSAGAYANNISVTNVCLYNQNTSAGANNAANYTMVQFTISWENSWRNNISGTGYAIPYNWDAAWVFVKYRITVANGGDGLWKHAWLNNTGHTAPNGSTIDIGLLTPGAAFNATTNPGLGAFIYRSADGVGPNTFTNAQLRWNYGANSVADNALVDIQVFAIEMVYVPQGSFYVGDGTTNIVRGQFQAGTSNTYFQVTSESTPSILGGSADGNLRNNNTTGMTTADDFSTAVTQPLLTAFPKGYIAFYCMKYEISQQEYVDFLSTLTRTQQTNKMVTTAEHNFMSNVATSATPQSRNDIKLMLDPGDPASRVYGNDLNNNGTAGEVDDGQNIACNFLSWANVAAYLDWSGLRPMTELEFEKACRGTLTPVVDEYAWGNSTVYGTQYTFSGSTAGTSSEVMSNPGSGSNGNANYTSTVPSTNGPLRVGSFATSGSTKIISGSTYYGIMEMSGDLWERIVTVGHATGRTFTGAHGNGVLTTDGNADASNWPGTDATGTGVRGATCMSQTRGLRVSDRGYASYIRTSYTDGFQDWGGRGVRTAP